MRICDRAVTYVSDKIVYVAVQMKDGAIYVGTAALMGVTAASDAVGDWVSEFVGSAVGSETALPGKPGEVVRVDTPPPLPSEKETFGSEIPSWPGEPVGSIGVPSQENAVVDNGAPIGTPNKGPIIVDPIFSTSDELKQRAKELGYGQRISPQKAPFNSHGQPVFWNGKNYITPDVDGHNVSDGWKVFDRRGNRVGTYDKDLNWVKK
jgi:filamentous hemagglutinin